MDFKQNVLDYWQDINMQLYQRLPQYFNPNATIYWHNSNEKFDPQELARVYQDFGGAWHVEIERLLACEGSVISIINARNTKAEGLYRAVSFFEYEDGLVRKLHEYWSRVGFAPDWRHEHGLGSNIF